MKMKRKTNNSKKVIIGLVIALTAVALLLIIVNILEERAARSDVDDLADNVVAEYDEAVVDDGDEPADDEEPEDEEPRRLFYVGNAEMYEILNDTSDEGFFVYVGRPGCPHCVAFEPTLEETLQYLDRDMRYFQIDLAAELNDESEMTMSEILTELDVTGVPRIVYIENGEVIDSLGGNRPQEDVLEFFEENGGLN